MKNQEKNNRLSLCEWMTKHNVNIAIETPHIAISRSLNSLAVNAINEIR